MPKKTILSKKKPAGFTAPIQQIESCIDQDFAQLSKTYPKVLAGIEKELSRVSKELKKSKAAAKPAKRGKGAGRGKVVKASNNTGLEKELSGLKAEKAAIANGYKKFKAGKKVWTKFEKSWAKKLKKTSKVKKSVRKTGTKRATKSVTQPSAARDLQSVE